MESNDTGDLLLMLLDDDLFWREDAKTTCGDTLTTIRQD